MVADRSAWMMSSISKQKPGGGIDDACRPEAPGGLQAVLWQVRTAVSHEKVKDFWYFADEFSCGERLMWGGAVT